MNYCKMVAVIDKMMLSNGNGKIIGTCMNVKDVSIWFLKISMEEWFQLKLFTLQSPKLIIIQLSHKVISIPDKLNNLYSEIINAYI